MAQFDVYKNRKGGLYPYFVDVQTDALAALPTRVCVPLIPAKNYAKPIVRLHPTTSIGEVTYVLRFEDVVSIPATECRAPVTSLAHQRSDLVAAIDFLFTGS